MEKKDLQKLKEKFLRKYPLFGEELAKYPLVINNQIETAGTDGNGIVFNQEFLNTLTESQALFLLAHELLHLRFAHLSRFKTLTNVEKNFECWNVATDAVINANLVKDGFELIEGGVDMPWAINYTSEQVYKYLIKDKKNYENQKPLDNHDMWDNNNQSTASNNNSSNSDDSKDNNQQGKENQSQDNNQQSQSENGNEQNNDQNNNSKNSKNNNSNKNQGKNVKGDKFASGKRDNNSLNSNEDYSYNTETKDFCNEQYNEQKMFEQNRQVRKKIANEKLEKIKQNLINVQADKPKETIKSNKGEEICDWKLLLKREFDEEDLMWSQRRSVKANNYGYRIEDYISDEKPITEVILDTSSSIDENLLKAFLKQVKFLLCDTDIIVGTFSSSFHGWQEVKTQKDIDKLNLSIGGGTNFDEASKAFSLDPKTNKICFTDGEDYGNAEIKNKRRDIVWVCFNNKTFKPDYGKVIYVSKKEILDTSSEKYEDREF